jgi:7-cyano-7-deazaguanine reductase
MALKQLDNSNISKHLGKSSEYACHYDPSLLVREPRQSNRKHIKIKDDALPFVGYDTWNGYEVTALNNNGLPFSLVVKFVYPCDSKYIVESKSLKLYFNSFSMTKLGNTHEEVLDSIIEMSERDLSALLETDVRVMAYSNRECLEVSTSTPVKEWNIYTSDSLRVTDEEVYQTFNQYDTLEDGYPVDDVFFTEYTETPSLLKVVNAETPQTRYHSALLRSRCRVTSQPDSGDVFIHIKGQKTVDPISLLQYIVSFRDECHFHEEICETIYKRLWDLLEPEELCVKCLYARRGSWDINPERASESRLLHINLSDHNIAHVKLPRQ